jgi:hypothetical protein
MRKLLSKLTSKQTRMPIFVAAATLALAALTVAPAATAATSPAGSGHRPATPAVGIRVLYNGRMVSYAALNHKLGRTYCDDFLGKGRLTCYGTQRAMESYLLRHGGYYPSEAARIARNLGITTYPHIRRATSNVATDTCYPGVILFLWSKAGGKGSEVSLYCDYEALQQIGWQNKGRSNEDPQALQGLDNDVYKNADYQKLMQSITAPGIQSMGSTSDSEQALQQG